MKVKITKLELIDSKGATVTPTDVTVGNIYGVKVTGIMDMKDLQLLLLTRKTALTN